MLLLLCLVVRQIVLSLRNSVTLGAAKVSSPSTQLKLWYLPFWEFFPHFDGISLFLNLEQYVAKCPLKSGYGELVGGSYFAESKDSARGIYEAAYTVASGSQDHRMNACS